METAFYAVFFGTGYLAWQGKVQYSDFGASRYSREILGLENFLREILIKHAMIEANQNK